MIEYLTLEQLGTVSRGKSRHRPRNDPKLYGGKFPFIQTADVKSANFYITSYNDSYNDVGLSQSKLWESGTLCITIAANIADTGVLAFPSCFPDSILGFIPFENISDVRYIKYCFDLLQKDFKNISQGTAQDNLSLEKLLTIKFPVPPFPTQCRIAEILSSYDDLIENNQKQIKLLEEAAMLLYKEWFVRLRFPGHENAKIVDGVPEGWRKGNLQELIDIKYGKDHKKLYDGDIPIYGSGGIMRKGNKSLYNGESVLIPRKGSLNNIMFICEEFWTVDTMFYSIPKRAFIMPYVYLYLKGWDMYAMNTGAAVPSTTTETLNSMQVSIPSEHLLEKFDIVVQSYFSCANALKTQVNQAKTARDKLLPKLMNGEIEVL